MNKAKLKSYAPAARRDFIQAVSDRANVYGLSEKGAVPVEESGDVAIIGGRPFPRRVAAQRRNLEARVKREGFGQVMEAVAYTWFNRFLALRYMELHSYLDHGFRVLSNSGSGTIPEILEHATELDLPGLNKQQVIELKLDGSKDAELYRLLLVAQCNALHAAMPFLFEKIDDETELLLPDNLLHSDSLIRKLVNEIEEEDWQEVEIIGWLYQFYISEKKDQVIGKVVKSEDIPAATQLFTPNWIVKYMVQNSLGRQWLATYPASPLKPKMEYYIEPAEQTDEVKAQLAAITPDSLDPEKLTLLDPACGSGHILVEAYDVFKEIYLERGYSNRDFPRLILEKNLYGLDIDDRAAQMAGFALLMKARKDDRRILRSNDPVKLHVMAIQESGDISISSLPRPQGEGGVSLEDIAALIDLFKHGKTFGSLIQVPKALGAKLPQLEKAMKQVLDSGDLYAVDMAKRLLPLVEQAQVLAGMYDCVVANPPYMGIKFYNADLKLFVSKLYASSKQDLYGAFINRNRIFTSTTGFVSMLTIPNWMFLSNFEEFRRQVLDGVSIDTFAYIGRGAFGSDFGTCTFSFLNTKIEGWKGNYRKLFDKQGEVSSVDELSEKFLSATLYIAKHEDFYEIPGAPLAFWASKDLRQVFSKSKPLSSHAVVKQGLSTTDNDQFLRYWHELANFSINFDSDNLMSAKLSGKRWFPFNKGGEFRKWYGNQYYVVDWQNDGERIKDSIRSKYPYLKGNTEFVAKNTIYYFKESVSWSRISIGALSLRYYPSGYIFSDAGSCIFSDDKDILLFSMGFLNSKVIESISKLISPTVTFEAGQISSYPLNMLDSDLVSSICMSVRECIDISKTNWDYYETSYYFEGLPFIKQNNNLKTILDSWNNWNSISINSINRLKQLEERNNNFFIESYGLHGELTPEVPEDQITLARADREADMKRLISYTVGCMMGRYSLDQPGLVYANSGNIGFDPTRYQTFPADDDGIVPVMDMDWFPDDAASRFEEFLKVAWSPETLEENLKFVADSLTPKTNETPRETIRRYISTQFFKDHLQTYKKRPIYWLFSSGKQRAFECLVYLHRYNEATLSRMRNEYVTPLQGKFTAQADYLANEVGSASSTAERNRLQKQLDTLKKKQTELAAFDDLLRHYADQRISLDLDDGVKVNYGRFGALLAEVKAITGENA